jgi:lipoyl(octanoyl) transferase
MHIISLFDKGLVDYQVAWDFQRILVDKLLIKKNETCVKFSSGFLIFCEHPHVYTLGKSGSPQNLLVNENFLKEKGAGLFRTDRGGDITYHGPGQIVGYPILDLNLLGIGVKEYVNRIEETIINTLRKYGITAERLQGATGVWLDTKTKKARKICAIGVKVSRGITMHGFAFNVNTDLSYFNYINPCGFTDKSVTSLEKELGKKQDMQKVKDLLKENFAEIFKISYSI